MTSKKVLRHVNQETILTVYHHGNTWKYFKFHQNTYEKSKGWISIESSAFSKYLRIRNFLIIREKSLGWQKVINWITAISSEQEAVERNSSQSTRRPIDHFYRLQLVHRCKFNSLIQPVIHSFKD